MIRRYYIIVAPVSARRSSARAPEPDRKGDSRRTGRVNPAPRPLVRAMHARPDWSRRPARAVAGDTYARRAVRRRRRRGPNTCPRRRVICRSRALRSRRSRSRRRRDRLVGGTPPPRTWNHTEPPLLSRRRRQHSPHSLRRPTPENAPAAAPHLSEFDAGAPRTSHRCCTHSTRRRRRRRTCSVSSADRRRFRVLGRLNIISFFFLLRLYHISFFFFIRNTVRFLKKFLIRRRSITPEPAAVRVHT